MKHKKLFVVLLFTLVLSVLFTSCIQGEQGVPGPKGEKGDVGATGPQGEQGEKGDTGALLQAIYEVKKCPEINADRFDKNEKYLEYLALYKDILKEK